MKKFLIRLTCLLLILAAALGLVGQYYASHSPIFQEFQIPETEMPETVDLAVIGSSHALYAIDLREYSDGYFNFSMAGQTPAYDYMLLREYEDRIADGATILMTVSYFSPFWTEMEGQFEEKQTRYYRMLSKENIVDYDPAEAFRIRMTETLPMTRIFYTETPDVLMTIGNALRKDLRSLFSKKEEVPVSEPAAKAAAPADASPASTEEVPGPALDLSAIPGWYQDLDHAIDYIELHYVPLIEPTYPRMNDTMAQAYENIFTLAEAHSWKVIAVIPPFLQEYNQVFPQIFGEDFYTVFHKHLDTLFQDHDIELWDYSQDERFSHTPIYFMDLDHLEVEGRKVFARILAQRLGMIP